MKLGRVENLQRNGRPKGVRNKATLAREEHAALVLSKVREAGLMAIKTLTQAMDPDQPEVPAQAVTAAKTILDRLVPTLKAVEVSGGEQVLELVLDMRSPEARVASNPEAPAE